MSSFSKKILATIVYYDILDYPLTAFEIWKYLLSYNMEHETSNKKLQISLGDIVKELESEKIKKYTGEYRGFYFLQGRKELVGLRIEKNKISQSKFKIIKKVVFWLRLVPYVRMAGVTGRVAMKNAGRKSDLDFLIVLKPGKIFTGRLLTTLAIHLLGKRRYGTKITDRVCLNYFITEQSLEIKTKDLFSASEYSFLLPVFGLEVFKKFQKANSWIKNYKINYAVSEAANLKMTEDNLLTRLIREIGEFFLNFNFIEKWLKRWQMDRIMSDARTYKKQSAVMADDEALIFLPDPQGPKIYERFRKRMEKLTLD